MQEKKEINEVNHPTNWGPKALFKNSSWPWPTKFQSTFKRIVDSQWILQVLRSAQIFVQLFILFRLLMLFILKIFVYNRSGNVLYIYSVNNCMQLGHFFIRKRVVFHIKFQYGKKNMHCSRPLWKESLIYYTIILVFFTRKWPDINRKSSV